MRVARATIFDRTAVASRVFVRIREEFARAQCARSPRCVHVATITRSRGSIARAPRAPAPTHARACDGAGGVRWRVAIVRDRRHRGRASRWASRRGGATRDVRRSAVRAQGGAAPRTRWNRCSGWTCRASAALGMAGAGGVRTHEGNEYRQAIGGSVAHVAKRPRRCIVRRPEMVAPAARPVRKQMTISGEQFSGRPHQHADKMPRMRMDGSRMQASHSQRVVGQRVIRLQRRPAVSFRDT